MHFEVARADVVVTLRCPRTDDLEGASEALEIASHAAEWVSA